MTTPLEDNVVETYRLLDDVEDAGHMTVATRDVRRTLGGQPLDGDEPDAPQSDRLRVGQELMVPAEVLAEIPQGVVLGLRSGDCVMVPADTHATEARIVKTRTPWWPPQTGDVVLDSRGVSWERVHHYRDGDQWATTASGERYTDDQLARLFGPLTLIARDGKRWEG